MYAKYRQSFEVLDNGNSIVVKTYNDYFVVTKFHHDTLSIGNEFWLVDMKKEGLKIQYSEVGQSLKWQTSILNKIRLYLKHSISRKEASLPAAS